MKRMPTATATVLTFILSRMAAHSFFTAGDGIFTHILIPLFTPIDRQTLFQFSEITTYQNVFTALWYSKVQTVFKNSSIIW